MNNNQHIKQIIQLSKDVTDRHQFHKQASELLIKIATDKNFWEEVFKQNLTDKVYLHRKWSMYEIPYFHVYENDDFYLKVHLFTPLKSKATNIAASAIHHHNNYLLSTYAAFGSGYETMLFEKNPQVNPTTKEVNLKIRERFTQSDRKLHMIDAWEPHVVINPTSLSATLNLWSPDKKRATDSFRSNPVLKALKTPLRKIIYALGLDKQVGIAEKETYQYYTQNNKFYGVTEDDFFAPTRAQVGEEVDNYSVQTLFAFMQQMGFTDKFFFNELKKLNYIPAYYQKWINMILNDEIIPETYAKETINIPDKIMTLENILETNRVVNNL